MARLPAMSQSSFCLIFENLAYFFSLRVRKARIDGRRTNDYGPAYQSALKYPDDL